MEKKTHDPVYKNKGEEIAATGKCDGECVFGSNQYSEKYSEEDARKLLKDVTWCEDRTPFNAFANLGNNNKQQIDMLNEKFDKEIDDHIKKIDSIPEPTKSPCEESEQICEVFSNGKKEAERVLKNSLMMNGINGVDENGETELNFKLTIGEKIQIKKKAKEYGFKNLSDYMRVVLLNAKIDVQQTSLESFVEKCDDPVYGDIYHRPTRKPIG